MKKALLISSVAAALAVGVGFAFAPLADVLTTSEEDEAADAILSVLLDPDAAKFRNMERCPENQNIWSGEVNSKNAWGAFTGFRPFFSWPPVAEGAPPIVAIAGGDEAEQAMFTVLFKQCFGAEPFKSPV